MDIGLSEHLARLDLERRRLREILERLDEEQIASVRAVDGWTVKDVLAHIAFWDRWELEQMRRMVDGGEPEQLSDADVDARNAATVHEWRNLAAADVVRELHDAREEWVRWLKGVTEEELRKPRTFHGEDWAFAACVRVQWEHDREHGEQIARAVAT